MDDELEFLYGGTLVMIFLILLYFFVWIFC
jgi:hypothetical protein